VTPFPVRGAPAERIVLDEGRSSPSVCGATRRDRPHREAELTSPQLYRYCRSGPALLTASRTNSWWLRTNLSAIASVTSTAAGAAKVQAGRRGVERDIMKWRVGFKAAEVVH
jgi:hypothetical protein